jgi:putative intracellular protease/amidase
MKPTIALFLYDPKCSVQSGNGVIQALGDHYNFKIFSKNSLEDNFFDDVDIVLVPGGFGDAETFKQLFKNNADRVRNFVRNGGKYVGICMGAYWAGSYYLNILQDVDAVQYLSRPGTDTRRPHAKNISITWQGTPMNMFWYDGCALVGDATKFNTIATYANGDAMAIIQGNIGLIGCHPESQQFWYDSYTWMKGKYHDGTHHSILLNFVNQLNTG